MRIFQISKNVLRKCHLCNWIFRVYTMFLKNLLLKQGTFPDFQNFLKNLFRISRIQQIFRENVFTQAVFRTCGIFPEKLPLMQWDLPKFFRENIFAARGNSGISTFLRENAFHFQNFSWKCPCKTWPDYSEFPKIFRKNFFDARKFPRFPKLFRKNTSDQTCSKFSELPQIFQENRLKSLIFTHLFVKPQIMSCFSDTKQLKILKTDK